MSHARISVRKNQVKSNYRHASIGLTQSMAGEGWHAETETAAPTPTTKQDRVDDSEATQWVKGLLKTCQEIVDQWMKAAAAQ
jgi:hypothetical protein